MNSKQSSGSIWNSQLYCNTRTWRIIAAVISAFSILTNYFLIYSDDHVNILPPSTTTTTITSAPTDLIRVLKNTPSSLKMEDAINSATGTLFKGDIVRTFNGERFFMDDISSGNDKTLKMKSPSTPSIICDKWNVVTTIFAPSEAVKRAAKVSGWCTVIVADTKTPQDYMKLAGLNTMESVVHYLSVQDQKEWLERESNQRGKMSAVGKFLNAIPYKHFSRKNIGYLYAILNGAKVLFDFDDDNLLPINNVTGEVIPPVSGFDSEGNVQMINTQLVVNGPNVFNHHPLMGATVNNSWPRGFPLRYIKDRTTQGQIVPNADIRLNMMQSVGVLQFCANDNPDIDAIHRLVHPLPMTFRKPITTESTNYNNDLVGEAMGSLVAPSHTFVPYNAQATIHTYNALWALLLPITVPGRVSDIWRGYFAEALFRDLGLSVVFLPPSIVQERNEHDYLADMQAELDLYFKAGKLIEFLSAWNFDAQSIPKQMEKLWIDLYERGYIEMNDVLMVQLWLAALVEINYKFPTKRYHRMGNTVLMGQFNYASDSTTVMFWHQKWRQWFNQINIRGPFSSVQRKELTTNNIDVYEGRNDQGYFSPIENLAMTMQEYKNVTSVTGVLYAHDDMLLNISSIFQDFSFGATTIVTTTHESDWDNTLVMHRDGMFSFLNDPNSTKYNFQEINRSPQLKWPHARKCLKGYLRLNSDPRSDVLREQDGSIHCSICKQSDLLYVPMTYANEFTDLAKLILDNEVFLECGMPFIVRQLVKHFNATIHIVDLCTTWKFKIRGKAEMLTQCESTTSAIHPFKIGAAGFSLWNQAHDWSTLGTTPWSTYVR